MHNYGQYPTKQLLSFFWAAQTGHYAIEIFCLFGMLSFFRIFFQIFIEMCFQFKKNLKCCYFPLDCVSINYPALCHVLFVIKYCVVIIFWIYSRVRVLCSWICVFVLMEVTNAKCYDVWWIFINWMLNWWTWSHACVSLDFFAKKLFRLHPSGVLENNLDFETSYSYISILISH